MLEPWRLIGTHLALSADLLRRYGAALAALWAAGALAGLLLTRLAVEIGLQSRIAGMIALVPVILLQLLVFVSMFVILRNGLPNIRLHRWRRRMREATDPAVAATAGGDDGQGRMFAGALLAVLIPFYAYYAGWGLLGDTLRSYSQAFLSAQMERIDFTDPSAMGPSALEVGSTIWVVIAVVAIWAIRRIAKALDKRSKAALWPLLVVACEASWVLLGLYVISGWEGQVVEWLAKLPPPGEWLQGLIGAAWAEEVAAAQVRPVDWPPPFELWPWVKTLFWYAVLPLIWFNLGAIVYGHDLNMLSDRTRSIAGGALNRWQALPKPVADFIGHFWAGLVKRWHAVVNGVLLAASAGVALSVSVIVLWRLADWLGRWAWMGVAELIGPQDQLVWQVLATPLSLLFGAPGQPQDGLIVSVVQFCILAAGLELAGRAGKDRSAPSIEASSAPV
ncbi:hypothetical protein JJJ17_15965 [Paracoccus caeni]|uniref:Uncharacterized protein n=2 Tax=Paracoccus caeni TaxID=657651 RepID=A0A934W0Y4_9RHOB|nr:hypothetical protein [Paracoccus caeni]